MTHKEESSESNGVFVISNPDSTRRPSLAGSTKSGADFEKAMKETGYGKFNYLLLLLAFPASCASTYDSTSLSYVLPTATCDLGLDAYDRGYLNGVIYAGMISSSFFWGFMSDNFGRQRVMVIGYLGDIVFGLTASLSHSFWALLIFRFLSGVMISGPFSSFMSYLSEMSHAEYRDSLIMLVGVFQAVGSILQPLIAWAIIPRSISWSVWGGLLQVNSWRLFLLVSMVPSFLAWLGVIFCHESPKFLIARGRKDDALRVFRSMYSINTGRPAHTYSITKLKNDPHMVEAAQGRTVWKELTALFRPPHVYKALLVFATNTGGLMTLNTIRLWLPQLFFFIQQTQGQELTTCGILSANTTATTAAPVDCAHFKVDTSVYTNMIAVNLVTALCLILSAVSVRLFGKRNLLVFLFMGQAMVICGLGWVRPPLSVALPAAFVALSSSSSYGIIAVVVQVFPTHLRTMAVCLTMMFGRIGVVVGSATLPLCLQLSCPGTFVAIALISLFVAWVVCILAEAASGNTNPQSTESLTKE